MKEANEEFERRIKEYFKDWKICALQIGAIRKFFKENRDIEKYIEEILEETPEFENTTNVFQHLIFGIELVKCKTCRKDNAVETKKE